jgi:membrane-associated protease RseP (regulator of RpoE activity)
MLTILGIALFAVAILVSIALHEVGHLLPAKRFGVKVTQYMVGFGPTAWSRRRGETEYGVKWIPLGGYIRMIGMFPPKRGADPARLRRSSTGPFQAMVEDARRTSVEEVRPGDEHRVFYKLSVPKKVVVMLGGPTMNLLLGVVLLGIALSVVGAPRYELTPEVSRVSACVVPAADQRQTCEPDDPPTPAAAAGLRAGDVITSFAGQPVDGWAALQRNIRDTPAGRPVRIGVLRDGQRLTLTATLIRTQRPASAQDATPVEVSFLGVEPTRVVTGRETLRVAKLPGATWDAVTLTAGALARVPQRMVGVWDAAFGDGQRDPQGPIGVVGASRLGGEVAALTDTPFYGKVSWFLGLVAALNLALFVFNLVPLLPLDGGHIAGALYEGARRQIARLRRAPDPGPVDVARMLPVAYTVAILLIGMSGLLLYADVVNPVRLRG